VTSFLPMKLRHGINISPLIPHRENADGDYSMFPFLLQLMKVVSVEVKFGRQIDRMRALSAL
jgi:hypothetical protein